MLTTVVCPQTMLRMLPSSQKNLRHLDFSALGFAATALREASAPLQSWL